ncbi:hypothetical protein FLONG3_1195 [Fusarium longipes]|uniref:F-box domain-containing protein n=1 Tax=Fusarium longipes TaxID=694270 RepID=A0A395T7N9_9HYPO|nr:hypothetical protein FLONG3_1195 [Fusarium longipes]
MYGLLILAEELLAYICSTYLDRASLYQITFVNKQFHRIASPLLIRDWPIHLPSRERRTIHIHFVWHLIQNPQLAKRVRTLSLDISLLKESPPKSYSNEIKLRDVAALVREGLHSAPDLDGWCLNIEKGEENDVMKLILLLCPNIVKLQLEDNSYDNPIGRGDADNFSGFFAWLVGLLTSEPDKSQLQTQAPSSRIAKLCPLAELRRVVLPFLNPWEGLEVQSAAPFFHLPKLKSVASLGAEVGCMLYDVETTSFSLPTLESFPIGTSPVEELIFEDAMFDYGALAVFLRACKRVRKLVYIDPYDCGYRSICSCMGLTEALILHKTSLEELVIFFQRHTFEDFLQNVWSDSYGATLWKHCLPSLHQLKRLTIDIDMIHPGARSMTEDIRYAKQGDFTLPSSLEYLRLEGKERREDSPSKTRLDKFESILEEFGQLGKLRNLRTLDISGVLYDDPKNGTIERLEALAETRGVEVLFAGATLTWLSYVPDFHLPFR